MKKKEPKKDIDKSEGEIEKDIHKYLTELGIEWFWRNQVYKGRVKSGAYLQTGKAGISDRIIVDWGYTIFMETKDATGEQSDEQKEFEAHCHKNNQLYWLVRSKSDVERKLKELGVI